MPTIPVRVRQAMASALRKEKTPEAIVQNFINGQVISSNELSQLSEPQAQAVTMYQELSVPHIAATQQSVKAAGVKVGTGLFVCGVLSLVGFAMASKAVTRARAAG
jgi:hypothetical protein